jgi:predicted SAM-dependent methyltransferase
MAKTDKVKSLQALDKIIELTNSKFKVLDIGAGKQETHAEIFRKHGYSVDTVDFFENSTYKGDFNTVDISKTYDIVWASHCLEHQPNVNNFLKKIYSILNHNGYAVITVPPFKHQIVGGHLTLWNAGLLMYNLVLAGLIVHK